MRAMKQEPLTLLGGLTAARFFDEYWQKQPLMIRQAIPGFTGVLSPDELAGLACEEDAQSRLVLHQRGKWQLESGPFDETHFSRLPKKNWTLLVQGVNHFLPEAAELLQRFNFVPTARLDDLMVSFAPDGGGVGPHFDSYDVFLLQGMGKRLWRISDQDDMQLVDGAPLRILQNFHGKEEWLLEPGDMLYLPPRYAHWGIAVGECMTYSIGFRAPSAQELGVQFLSYLQDKLQLDGMYADADLQPQQYAPEISEQMIGKVTKILEDIRWDENEIIHFLGTYLTEPKAHIVFSRPRKISADKFAAKLINQGIQLALATQILTMKETVFINGESCIPGHQALLVIKDLAEKRKLAPFVKTFPEMQNVLYQWYLAGFLEFVTK